MCVCVAVADVEVSSPSICEKTGGLLCRPDRRCLSNSSMCNGVVDCSDASDELDCSGLYPALLLLLLLLMVMLIMLLLLLFVVCYCCCYLLFVVCGS